MAHEYGHGSSARRSRETLGPGNPNISNLPMPPPSAVKRSSSSTGMYPPPSINGGGHGRSMSSHRMSLAAARPSQPNFTHASPMMTTQMSHMGMVDGGTVTGLARGPRNHYSLAPGGLLPGGIGMGVSQHMGGGGGGGSSNRRSLMPTSSLPMSTPGRAGPMAHSDFTSRRTSVLPQRMGPPPPPSGMVPTQSNTMGIKATVSFFSFNQPPAIPADPKTLRSQTTRSTMAQEIINYLSENNFEMDMEMPIPTYKLMVTCPSGREVVALLKWMYKQVDPSYVFTNGTTFDVTYSNLLKNLRCPYEKTLTRSQFAAPQPANWPSFLALLQWLMRLAKMMASFGSGRFDDASAEAGFDVTSDRISFEFLAAGYLDWMSVDEDEVDDPDDPEGNRLLEKQSRLMEQHIKVMAQRFEEANSEHFQHLQELELEKKEIQDQIAALEEEGERLAEASNKVQVLEGDEGKFQVHVAQLHARVERLTCKIGIITDHIENQDRLIIELEAELQDIQTAVDRSGLTVADMDRLSAERERYHKSVESIQGKLDEVQRRLADAESATEARLSELESVLEEYNTLGFRAGVIPFSAKNAGGVDLELRLTIYSSPEGGGGESDDDLHDSGDGKRSGRNVGPDRLVGWDGSGHQPSTILNVDAKRAHLSSLVAVRKRIADRRAAGLEEDMSTQEDLRRVKEEHSHRESEVEGLHHRVRIAQSEYNKALEVTTEQANSTTRQVEKMEQELSQLRQDLDASVELAQQRELGSSVDRERLTVLVAKVRDRFHTDVAKILADIADFKVNVVTGLEEYETFVADVVETEWALGEQDGVDGGVGEDGYVDVHEVGGGEGDYGDDEDTALAMSTQQHLRIRGGS